jgi:hypothetical protein
MSESTSKSIDAGAAVANALDSRDPVVATAPADSNPNNTATAKTDPAFLHSPPDSNNTAKSDGSDSELSDLEDEPILSDPPQPVDPSDKNTSDEDKDKPSHEDIGEVLPDDWSGAVPIFKPTMHQFRDFKRFVCHLQVPRPPLLMTIIDGSRQQLWYEVWYHQGYSTTRMDRQSSQA